MYLKKCILQISIVAVFAVPVSAYAESWSCSNGNLVREVHVRHTTSNPVPCNVVYKKQTEGVEDQVLWNAENDEAYCIDKAKGLVATLESSGWVCTETIIDDAVDNGNVGETAPVMEEGEKPAGEAKVEPGSDS
jgi:hypothetical protein